MNCEESSSAVRGSSASVSVFYVYAHQDEPFRQKLEAHLSVLRRGGVIREWHDRAIGPGQEWKNEIDRNLSAADVILLLISADFISSDYCYDVELRRAMEHHKSGEAQVIPILVRDCMWESAQFAGLQALPRNGKAITSEHWHSEDAALTAVAEGIREAASQLRQRASRARSLDRARLDSTSTSPSLRELSSWSYVAVAAQHLRDQVVDAGFHPTLVVGVGRSGAIFAALIAGHLGSMNIWVNDRVYEWSRNDVRQVSMLVPDAVPPRRLLERVLVVDGEMHTAGTLEHFVKFYEDRGAAVRTAVAYVEQRTTLADGRPVPDFVGVEVPLDRDNPFWRGLAWKCAGYRNDAYSREEWEKLRAEQSAWLSQVRRDVYLVRHGESAANTGVECYSGITDHELTDAGRAQAQRTADQLNIAGIDLVYSSPLRRAVETAEIVCAATNARLAIVDDLREMSYGDWEGVDKDEVDRRWAAEHRAWKEDPVGNTPPGGEPADQVLERVRTWWNSAIMAGDGQVPTRIAVVGHKTVLRLLLCELTGRPIGEYRLVSMRNASISRVEVSPNHQARVVVSDAAPC